MRCFIVVLLGFRLNEGCNCDGICFNAPCCGSVDPKSSSMCRWGQMSPGFYYLQEDQFLHENQKVQQHQRDPDMKGKHQPFKISNRKSRVQVQGGEWYSQQVQTVQRVQQVQRDQLLPFLQQVHARLLLQSDHQHPEEEQQCCMCRNCMSSHEGPGILLIGSSIREISDVLQGVQRIQKIQQVQPLHAHPVNRLLGLFIHSGKKKIPIGFN